MGVYMGKPNKECDSEMLNHYKESNYHVVKDINIIEEGVTSTESNKDEKFQTPSPCKSNKDEEMKKDNIVLNLSATNESDEVSANDDNTCSTGSFTFPILERECNNTPERMMEPDMTNCRKNMGWKRVLCCKF
ncbi:hypothetical protein Lal_00020927 [Lupinus albus]|nr:hypothetical protein Lal_00020927 [Lupinus albus]